MSNDPTKPTPAMPAGDQTKKPPGATPSDEQSVLLLPVKVDAFVLNAAVCNGEDIHQAKIAPLTQPNYTFLRLDQFYIRNDILNHTDLHATTPAECNSRFTDLGTGEKRSNREGVYIHWMVPRPYRIGSAVRKEPPKKASGDATTLPGSTNTSPSLDPNTQGPKENDQIPDITSSKFQEVPTRWLVVRKLEDHDKIVQQGINIPPVQAWVVESDRKWDLDQIPVDWDLQVDVSPFVYADNKTPTDVENQAEVFIGNRTAVEDWHEDGEGNRNPRVNLSLLGSSNQLFPDYQPHNSNVFSIVDTFDYDTGTVDADKNPIMGKLQAATASYYVFGWHSEEEKDFMHPSTASDSREARIASHAMELKSDATDGMTEWKTSTAGCRLLCHGAMYNVGWNTTTKPKHMPADKACAQLTSKLPIAVGTTPMDALLTYVHSHQSFDPAAIQEIESTISTLQRLLHARDDGVDTQREVADMVMNWNYMQVQGGSRYYLSGENPPPSSKSSTDNDAADERPAEHILMNNPPTDNNQNGPKPTKPTDEAKRLLKELNRCQSLLDSYRRSFKRYQWRMFSMWWKYLSDVNGFSNKDDLKLQVQDVLTPKLDRMKQKIDDYQAKVNELISKLPTAKAGVQQPFAQTRDPTLLVGGIQSGWPSDFLEKVKVRVALQIHTSDDVLDAFSEVMISKFPGMLQPAARSLLREFETLKPGGPPLDKTYIEPLYHDVDVGADPVEFPEAPMRDRWESIQPWFPLFLEWEGEYTHIPFDHWTLDNRVVRNSLAGPRLRYGINDTSILYQPELKPALARTRAISGRVLILPQPNFSLKSKVEQVLSETSVEQLKAEGLTDDNIDHIRRDLSKLQFLSAPLSGFTNHLVTLVEGSHIKPTIRPQGEANRPLDAAIEAGQPAGFGRKQLNYIGGECDLTPYGTLVSLTEKDTPFFPVTHGQFRFTKINIIDKFGQAILAIDPRPGATAATKVYPCISDFYEPQPLATDADKANTVIEEAAPNCEYIQISPQINQPARLNSCFVTLRVADDLAPGPPPPSTITKEKLTAPWRPVDEWENPIWGWVVVNFANSGVQVFQPDGTFYREVRFGGPHGVQKSPPWLPFEPPKTKTALPANVPVQEGWKFAQLQLFVNQLASVDFLQSFIWMINGAMKNSPPAPTAYAEFMNSVIGKPMALVNMGWSIELATAPYTNESTLSKTPSDHVLESLSSGQPPRYDFKIKLGDKDRAFDGLIGYFNTQETPTVDSQLVLSEIFTHFTDLPSGVRTVTATGQPIHDFRTAIQNAKYPLLHAEFIDPDPDNNPPTPTLFEDKKNNLLSVFGALIDPFVATHGYTGVLPIQNLTLPSWTWQEAMKRMTGFFHIGPLLVTEDVPDYSPAFKLTPSYNLAMQDPKKVPNQKIGIPAVSMADWSWLQPYLSTDKNDDHDDDEERVQTNRRVYMPLDIKPIDERPRFEPAPYTAVEGYLQMKKPILRPDENVTN